MEQLVDFWLVWPVSLWLPALALGVLLSVATLWDLRDMVLPDPLNLAVFLLGLAVAAFGPFYVPNFALALIHAAAGLLLAWGFRALTYRLMGREPMGLGDVKLLGAASAWLGVLNLASVILIGSLVTLFALLVKRLATGKGDLSAEIPFGPGLALGFFLTLLLGPVQIWPIFS